MPPMISDLPMPKWFDALPEIQKAQARVRFILRLAALYASEDGTLSELSGLLDFRRNSLGTMSKSKESLGLETILKIEALCGREKFRREWLNKKLTIPA